MPTLVQGFSIEEEKALEEMRQKSLKQLELLRLRQVQYQTRHTGRFQGPAIDVRNTGLSFVARPGLKVATQNGDASKKYPQRLSEVKANRSGSVNKIGYLSNASKDFETHTVAESTREQNTPIYKNVENISHFSRFRPTEEPTPPASDVLGTNHNVQAKPLRSSGDADNFYNYSYENMIHYDWRTHMGGGDTQDEFYPKASYSDFANGPRSTDRGDVYEDGLTGELERRPRIETELSDSDGDSATDVITITDSPLDETLNARNKLASMSNNTLRDGEFNETRSARDLESDMRNIPTKGVYSHDTRGVSHVGEGFVGSVSPHQTSSAEGTPKSILRHRRMIDDNVRVESKYEHTPTKSKSRGRRGLNFSYSDVIDSDSAVLRSKSVNFSDSVESSDRQEQENRSNLDQRTSKSKPSLEKSKMRSDHVETTLGSRHLSRPVSDASKKPSQKFALYNETRNLSKKPHYVSPTDGSYTEERDLDENVTRNEQKVGSRAEKKGIQVENDGSKHREVSKHTEHSGNQTDKVKEVVQKNLLMHSGNDRKHASIVRDLESRPKSVIFDGNKGTDTKKSGNDSFLSKSYLDHPSTKEFSRLMDDRQGNTLLGYDWIAGLLDNDEVRDVCGQPDDLFEEVKEFRRQNKHECTGTSHVLNDVDLGRPITPEVQNPMHTCIHGYSVNERLFTEPVNVDVKGTSFCPVCLSSKREPSQDSPGFVRVSIPRSTLESPYKIKPHRRRSFDPIDSCALSQHCLAGYECSRPSSIATATNLDLKHAAHGIKSQLITTEEEARKIADSVSKTSQHSLPRPLLLPNVSIPRVGQETNSGDTMTLQSMSSQPSLSMSRSSTRDSRSVTDELLNTSHSFRYQLQSLEKERGIGGGGAQPNSTAFPLY